MDGIVREARTLDAKAILDIYAPYVSDAAVSFETEVPSLDEIEKRIEMNRPFGWYVYELKNKVIGFAYASKHRERKAYQWCCEVSVYVHREFHEQGVATHLYKKLISGLKEKGYVNAYAGITLPNEKSVSFHEGMGFKKIGVYEKIGYKLGRWHDVGWWGLRIQEPGGNPEEPN